MDFINNTGHIFSLPSFKEKPIGYEYEEFSYIFWVDSLNTSKLSINNCYIKPIYALYDISNIDVDNIDNELSIEIYFENSKVFSLVSSIGIQDAINKSKNLYEYIKLNNLDEETTFIKDKLINDDLFVFKTWEQINEYNKFDYIVIPIYVLANAAEEGVWISNLMIHITNNNSNEEDWCYISVGGEFVDEYEGLVINGTNMGISLPKDILKAINKEPLYNNEYNASLYNDKLKEYLLNYMGIRGELGNFRSAINSLKWFGYGDKLSISKLLKTDNEFVNQYLLDYFDISYDVLESFKNFKSDSLIALRLMTNYETGNWYEFNTNKNIFGENNPELESYFDKYIKVKIGNHDMPIENDDEKYWYWKPYFDFSFNELSIKLALLTYYYNKYFLPIHLNIHSSSLGYKVYANDIKLNMISNYGYIHPSIILNDKEDEIEFSKNHLHYFTKQIHIVDENYNEFNYNQSTISKIDLYEINDTCLSIPIKFKANKYYNCILILKKINDNKPTYEYILKNTIKFNSELNILNKSNIKYDVNKLKFAYKFNDSDKFSLYFDGYRRMQEALINACKTKINENIISILKDYLYDNYNNNDILYYEYNNYIYVIDNNLKSQILNETYNNDTLISIVPKDIIIKIKTQYNDIDSINNLTYEKFIISYDQILYQSNFNFVQTESEQYKNFVIYPKHLNIKLQDNRYVTNLYEYWVNSEFTINLLVNNKWYNYDFKTKIDTPILDFGTLNYRYYLNDNNYLISRMIDNNSLDNIHSLLFQHANDTNIDWNHNIEYLLDLLNNYDNSKTKDLNNINDYLYRFLNVNSDISFIKTIDLDNIDSLYQYYLSNYNIISNFAQIKSITDNNVIFNSYMHNTDLVISNNINFDVSFHDILMMHIENNLLYIDASYFNKEFYQYIVYRNSIIFIHESNVRKDFYFDFHILDMYQSEGNQYWYYDDGNNTYIFIKTEQDTHEYKIEYENNDELLNIDNSTVNIWDNEHGQYFKIMYVDNETLTIDDNGYFKWSDEDQCYYESEDPYTKIYIQDKLLNNINLYNYYVNEVQLPRLNKYLNSIHMYGLYDDQIEENNILVFHNDIDITVNGLNFIHGKYDYKNEESLRFIIKGQTLYDLIDSRYPDIYGLIWYNIDNLFSEEQYALSMYGLYINDENEFVTDEFVYNTTETLIYIGDVIYNNIRDLQVNNQYKVQLLDEYKDSEIFIDDDAYYFYNPYKYDLNDFNKKLKTKLLWDTILIDENGNELTTSVEDVLDNNYFIKVKFYYYDVELKRNKFATLKSLSNEGYNITLPNDETDLCYINKDDYRWEGVPIKISEGYHYYDKDGNEIKNQNPAMYWYNADTLKYENIDNALIELKRYWFNENDTAETIVNHFDQYIKEIQNGNDDNRESLRYTYRNYLSKDLTGNSGEFVIMWDTNLKPIDLDDNPFGEKLDIFNLCICIERNNGDIEIYSNKEDKFELYGNEKNVTAYFRLNCYNTINMDDYDEDIWIEPKLIKLTHNLTRVKYIPNEYTLNETIKVNFNGKQYEYGDNNDINTYNLYKTFFTLKYNIWDIGFNNIDNSLYKKLLYSIYDANNSIKLDYNKLDYDLYLMHDNEYWYCLYISKQTCESIYNEDELIIPNNKKEFTISNYYLKYEKSSKEILINRFEYISKLGKKQFNEDDIICCRIINNNRLPYNAQISSKWKITPMSIGMNVNEEFESKSEMSILSLPKNTNKYQKGYYNITVKYSLDRDIQHQFKNITNIKVI